MSPNGGDTHPPKNMAGCMVFAGIFLVFAIGVVVGFVLCKGLG